MTDEPISDNNKNYLISSSSDFDLKEAQSLLRESGVSDPAKEALIQRFKSTQYRQIIDRVEIIIQENLDEEKSQEVLNLLDDARNLVGDRAEIQQLCARVNEISNNYRALRKFESTRQACEALWNQEQGLIKQKTTSDKILNEIFSKANLLAKEAAEQFPKSLALDGLKNDAEMRYQMARKRYEIKTTADQTHSYYEAFEKLDKIDDKNTLIPWNDASGQQLEPISARDAIVEILTLAGDFAHKKAQEYLQVAQTELENHAPRLARAQIDKRKELWELHDEDNAKLQKYLDEKVLPDVDKLEKAESLLAQASTIGNLLQGWALVAEAVKTYPWVPNLGDVRETLIGRTLHQAAFMLSEAAKSYASFRSDASNIALDEAQSSITDARKMLDLARPSVEQTANLSNGEKLQALSQKAQELNQDILSARKFIDDVNAETSKLESFFAREPAQVQIDLDGLMTTYGSLQFTEKYGPLLVRFPRLQSLEARTQAFQNFENSLRELEDDFVTDDLEQIGVTLSKVRSILGDVKDSGRRERIKTVVAKLQGRQEFLEGRKVLADKGDVDDALKHFNKVVSYAEHADKQAAQDLIKRLVGERENEQKIGDALESAEELLKTQPKRAHEILNKVADIPTQKKKKVNTLLERARDQWEQQLLNRMERLREEKTTDSESIRVLAREILDLPAPHSEESDLKARNALAYAFALDAKIHADAGRWENAEASWKAAQEKDIFNSEYRQSWHDARLRRTKVQLEHAKGRQEIQGLLADLQTDIVDSPDVFELQAEYTYRLSQNLALDIEERLVYLTQAQSYIKVASNVSGISQALKGRLEDLNKRVVTDEKLLKTQNDIEKRMLSNLSLSQLSGTIQEVARLLETQNSSTTARNGLQAWWDGLVSRVVTVLEKKDDGLTDEQIWERFEVRSKIALLDAANPHARQLVRAVPRQVEDLLDTITSVVSDHSGLTLKGKDVVQVLNAQQKHVIELRDRSQVLYEMVERLSGPLGGHSSRLKTDIQTARVEIEKWLREFESFHLNVLQLREFLTQARQDDDWADFDHVLNEKINIGGFGSHRAVRMLLEERDRIQDKRRDLKALQDKIIDSAQDSQGLQFTQAIKLLDILENDSNQGDPQDDFGFRNELQIKDPLTGKIIRQALFVRGWLVERQKQTDLMLTWLAECGLADLVPTNIPVSANLSPAKKIFPWEDVHGKLIQELERGSFEDVFIALGAILHESDGDPAIRSKSLVRQNTSNVETMLKSYRGFIRLEYAHAIIAQPPFSLDAGLSRLVISLLQQASERLHVLDKNIKEINQLRKNVAEKQREWKNAEAELEQALNELRDVKGRLIPFGRDRLIQVARARTQKAILACSAIAPRHPILDDIDSLSM